MRFLVDAQLPPVLCRWFSARGHDADHVGDLGLLDAPDLTIAARTERDGSILVSKDEDFLLLRLPNRFAFLWLRVGNATNLALFAWLEPRWDRIESLLVAGEQLVEAR